MHSKTCRTCSGKRVIVHKGKTKTCPKCGGKGKGYATK